MADAEPPPLIVTLTLDPASQAAFDAVRTAHFPVGRLYVGAHVTLFHALPAAREREVAGALRKEASVTPPFRVSVTGPRFLGRGVAYVLDAPAATALRASIASRFADALTPQDRAKWSAHTTVQNKVSPELARRTHAHLATLAVPGPVTATGLALWRYRGGPWEPVSDHPFTAPPPGHGPQG